MLELAAQNQPAVSISSSASVSDFAGVSVSKLAAAELTAAGAATAMML